MRYIQCSKLIFVLCASILALTYSSATHAQPLAPKDRDPSAFVYVSPLPGTLYASAGTSIVLRHTEQLDARSLAAALFTIVGSRSGQHSGTVQLAPDGNTIFFYPDRAFTPAETIHVTVAPGLRTAAGSTLPGADWRFTVTPQADRYAPVSITAAADTQLPDYASATPKICAPDGKCSLNPAGETAAMAQQATQVQSRTMPHYVTAPLLPSITITKTGLPLANGYLFTAPFTLVPSPGRGQYALIFDDNAELVYYARHDAANIYDLKVQPNGFLSYAVAGGHAEFYVYDNHYQKVGNWRPGNGYPTDVHDFQMMPNGHALLMSYARMPYDLSPFGGQADATLIYLVVQEVDQNQNVYFEWNSLDHVPITDTNQPLTVSPLDYMHGNALELDADGNILLSSRHLSEITKINRTTGQTMWRLGGKENQFTFIGATTLPGVGAFSWQHDIRRLSNGDITVFDNGIDFINAGIRGTRGVEFRLDEAAKTATFVREFRTSPDVISEYMGNMQRLENGNTLLGWGGGHLGPPSPPRMAITEFTSDGRVALNATYADAFINYRAFRFPWHGFPTTPPALVAITTSVPISLYYSWNGATEVVSYTVAGGAVADGLENFAAQPKTGFEEATAISGAPPRACFFRITPYDKTGQVGLASRIVYLGDAFCPQGLTVAPAVAASRAIGLVGATGTATVTLDVAAGTVATSTVFALTPGTPITAEAPAGMVRAGIDFVVSAFDAVYLAGDSTKAATIAAPLQLTIDYSTAQVPHIAQLRLARWDAAQQNWSTAGITLLSNDTLQRRLIVLVSEPGAFALLADNAAPASADALFLTDEDTAYPFTHVRFAYFDADGDPLHAIIIDPPPALGLLTLAGVPISRGQAISAPAISQLVFTPPADANGIPYTTFGFRVNDGFVVSTPYTGTLLVQPVNDAPVARDDGLLVTPATGARAAADIAVPLDVLANDDDVDNDRLRIISASTPEHGTASIAGDQLIYAPDLSYQGQDQFSYTITDDRGGQATAKVTVSGVAQRMYLPDIRTQSSTWP